MSNNNQHIDPLDIAVIGMDCRFPGANNIHEFWNNLCNGVESVHRFTDEELLAKGVSRATLDDPNYVKAAPMVENIEFFDAEFFNIGAADAETMDPQRRLFLECCWNTLETAGYDAALSDQVVGVFAGAGPNSYFMNLMTNREILAKQGYLSILINNDKDYLPTQVSYQLNLRGPSVNVNTACSSSLVAVHLARQSILLGECDMALAGGSAVVLPYEGYMYEEGNILSPDGHCRAFDARGKGMLWGSGCGVVLLKRLNDALRDNDEIFAVIKGSAINNDGSHKIGFTAPSVDGQAEVIALAYSSADIDPATVRYIEAHGTGTAIGDPIELQALTDAFRIYTKERQFCAIGSVKTNFGHLGAAAGIASFIKTALSLRHKKLPPSLNFESPNPKIDFEKSPFYVNDRLQEWHNEASPLRAGVSSLAVGGTNAHIVLEAHDDNGRQQPNVPAEAKPELLVVSARTATALEKALDNLAVFLKEHPDLSLPDVAYTLRQRRRSFPYRAAFVCGSLAEAIAILRDRGPENFYYGKDHPEGQPATVSPRFQAAIEHWLSGKKVDWEHVEGSHKGTIVPLPPHPFERKRYWIDYSNELQMLTTEQEVSYILEKNSDIADFMYVEKWTQVSFPFTQSTALQVDNNKDTMLVFADSMGIADSVTDSLKEKGFRIIKVTAGNKYGRINDNDYSINPAKVEDYNTLFGALHEENIMERTVKILHFMSITKKHDHDLLQYKEFIKSLDLNYYSLLYLVQAVNTIQLDLKHNIIVFAENTHNVSGNDCVLPGNTTVMGVCKVAQQEYPHLHCRVVDIDSNDINAGRNSLLGSLLARDILMDTTEFITAYRGKQRWTMSYEPVRIEKEAPRYHDIEKGAVYLFYGGLFGIPNNIIHYLIDQYKIKVLLIEDDWFFPKESEWDTWLETHRDARLGSEDPEEEHAFIVNQKIHAARKLQEKGAVVLGGLQEFASKNSFKKKFERVTSETGNVQGIFHCAGGYTAAKLLPLYMLNHEVSQAVLAANAYGLFLLDDFFADHDLDFRVVFGSLSCMLAGPFFAVFTAANYMANSYALSRSYPYDQAWVSQYWDLWDTEYKADPDNPDEVALGQYINGNERIVELLESQGSLTLEEGLGAFERIFTVKELSKVVVSATDLRLRYDRWINLGVLREEDDTRILNERPELETVYEAPETELEQRLAQIFEETLSVNKIGIHDNFYDLGGHSLLAVKLASKLRGIIDDDIQVFVVLQNPTISELAGYIKEHYLAEV